MTKRLVRIRPDAAPQLDLFNVARPGPHSRERLPASQVSQIARTVGRTSEVLVKVTGGGTKIGAVRAHLDYISRKGREPIETDDGQSLNGKDAQKALLDDWHLDLSAGQYRRGEAGKPPTRALKLVHHVVLSMPAPTPPEKVLAAARKFAREQFGAERRYAMVLHTDQRHPHVHLVVQAEGLTGRKLHIDKRLLRQWREDFARYLREQGVAANATPRFVRGASRSRMHNGALRSQRRHASTAMRDKVRAVAQELMSGGVIRDPARKKLLETRRAVVAGWLEVAKRLDHQGESALAAEVRRFVREMPPVMTDKERIAQGLLQALTTHANVASGRDPTREYTPTR